MSEVEINGYGYVPASYAPYFGEPANQLMNYSTATVEGFPLTRFNNNAGTTLEPEQVVISENLLGRGGYASVFEGTIIGPVKRRVAVKVFNNLISSMQNPNQLQKTWREEMHLQLTLKHPNILRAIGAIETTANRFALITEAADLSLATAIKAQMLSDLNQKIILTGDIAHGLQFLHQKKIAHRDIKPANVLLFREHSGTAACMYRAKIADFGLSIVLDRSHATSYGSRGTVLYMAPELIAGRGANESSHFGLQVDIYGLGVTLFEMFTGRSPVADLGPNDFAIMNSVCNGKRPQFRNEDFLPETLKTLISECWHGDGAMRPKIEKVISWYHNTLPKSIAEKLVRLSVEDCEEMEDEENEWNPPSELHYISRNDFQLDDMLGTGNFGQVWKGKWKNLLTVAIKTSNRKDADEFLREAVLMNSCDHPNLVRCYAYCSKPPCIVNEFMPGGSLLECLRSEKSQAWKLDELLYISLQVVQAMCFLEQKGMIHGDLAARNVLLGELTAQRLTVKVADFGLARLVVNEFQIPHDSSLPIMWCAPEVLTVKGIFTTKSDVWSFGILLQEIFTKGEQPYFGMSILDVVEKVKHGYRLPRPTECPASIRSLQLQCWDEAAAKRPTFATIKTFLCGVL